MLSIFKIDVWSAAGCTPFETPAAIWSGAPTAMLEPVDVEGTD